MEKDRFCAQFMLVTPPNALVFNQDKDNKDAQPSVTCKLYYTITNTKKKALCNYYFDPQHGKPA